MTEPAAPLNVGRVALAGALTAAVFFALCWAGAFLPIGPATHMYLQLFTAADTTSATALVQGLFWSVVFGLVVGALFAGSYNLIETRARGNL